MKLSELLENDYHAMSEDDMVRYVTKWGNNIVDILKAGIRPSLKVLMTAVKDARHPDTLKNIISVYGDELNPKVRLAAVKAFGPNIRHIKNPTEKEQLAAINDNPFSIDKIPTELLTKKTLLTLLNNKNFIEFNNGLSYDKFVKNYFKDNNLLMNKWLRYAKNIREQS